MLGTIDRDHVARLVRLLAAQDAAGIIAALQEIDEQFPDYARLLEDLARLLQRIAVYRVVAAERPKPTNPELAVDESGLDEVGPALVLGLATGSSIGVGQLEALEQAHEATHVHVVERSVDLVEQIYRFGRQKKIFHVHFRNLIDIDWFFLTR